MGRSFLALAAFLAVALSTPALAGPCALPSGNVLEITSGAGICVTTDHGPVFELLTPDPAWTAPFAGSTWVSYGNTICPGCTDTSPDPNAIYLSQHEPVVFTHTFTIPTGFWATSALLNVLVDDNAAISINGTEILALTCAASVIAAPEGCYHWGDPLSLSLTSGLFQEGTNTIVFTGQSLYRASFGLDYLMTVNLTHAPEPASFSLVLLAGLSFVGYRRWSRRKIVR